MTERTERLFTREGAFTRDTTRGYDLKELGDHILMPLMGAVITVLGGWTCWLLVTWVRRGYFDSGDEIVYASQEPFWFYFSIVFIAALALGCVWLGPQIIAEAWRERGYTAGIAERLLRRRHDRE